MPEASLLKTILLPRSRDRFQGEGVWVRLTAPGRRKARDRTRQRAERAGVAEI